MRIKKNTSDENELKRLMAEIKKDSVELRNLFWTEEELRQRKDAVNFFDARLQLMAYCTIKNLENYQQFGWKELFDEGENHHGTAEPE